MKKLKIAILINSISHLSGGLFNSVRLLVKEYVAIGMDVKVYSNNDDRAMRDSIYWTGIELSLHKTYGPKQFSYSPGKLKELLSEQYDILHVHGLWQHQSFVAYQWSRITGRPLVVSPRGMLDQWAVNNSSFKKKIALKLFQDRVLKNCSIHALTVKEASSCSGLYPNTSICVIPNGVSLPKIGEARRSEGGKKLLYFSRINSKKGILELLDAWDKIISRQSSEDDFDWVLWVCGWEDGISMHRALESLSSRTRTKVVYKGGIYDDSEKDSLFRQSDAFILPSFSEGLPMSVLEAWSYELPVIMTRECNLEVGYERHAAFEIFMDDEKLVDTLLKVLVDEENLLRTYGKNGRLIVEECFTWRKVATSHINNYCDLLRMPGIN
ncbi:glycosyltransferase [Granulosicoccus sp. 3-233]|uniref:glycosyltransferase n=1 Tax=Granulosicoccus sp. 3-233 TaxID=3417969 RepID=UPI003D33BAEC